MFLRGVEISEKEGFLCWRVAHCRSQAAQKHRLHPIALLGGPAWCCVNWGPRSHIDFPLSWSEPAACHLPPDVIFGDMSFI